MSKKRSYGGRTKKDDNEKKRLEELINARDCAVRSRVEALSQEKMKKLVENMMKREYYRAKTEQFSRWLANLNTLDFQRRTRTFFRDLRKRQRSSENYGPIKDSSGKLSQSWFESLETWATFYTSLYKIKGPNSFDPPPKENCTLYKAFSLEDPV